MSDWFNLGRLAVAPIDFEATVGWVLSKSARGTPCVVVTSNINHLDLAERDELFCSAVRRAELNVADGWPLVLANRLLKGPRLPGRVAGVDLVGRLLASELHLRIAVLGGPPGAAEELARRYQDRHEFVVVDPLPKGSWDDPEGRGRLRASLRECSPNLTFIAIGAPRQELLADDLRDYVRGPIVCCGAAVEILAGVRPRAPKLVQKVGLEWAFRAALEPTRLLPRYARATKTFLVTLTRELRRSLVE